MVHKLSDRMVRRVLICLASPRTRHQSQSLEELTTEYNQKYPSRLGLFSISPRTIKSITDFLVEQGFSRGEVFSIISRIELDKPTKFYSITSAGINFLAQRR